MRRFARGGAAGRLRAAPRVRLCVDELERRDALSTLIAIDAAANRHAINPNIYGVNYGDTATLAALNIPINRYGGTPASTYNWQANASNRGADYFFESISDGSSTPGAFVDNFVASSQAGGAQAFVTVPTLGYVAKLGNNRATLGSFPVGTYGTQQSADGKWGDGVYPNGSFVVNNPNNAMQTATPAFEQGMIQHLVQQFGAANAGGVRYYGLDNEPGIWHSEHRDVHPVGATMQEVRDKILAYGAAIKAVDPNAQLIGPEEWNFEGYLSSGYDNQWLAAHNYQGTAPDRAAHGGMDYVPWLLDQLRQNNAATGQRLLDILGLHYYPQDGSFNPEDPAAEVTAAQQRIRNQSTRSLWDPTYRDQSYLGDNGYKIDLFPLLHQWVNTYYPGTQIALSEYNFGAENHMNGATTQADVFGLLGREQIDMAERWTAPALGSPTAGTFQLFRNYDGAKHTFGDTSVSTTTPNPDHMSAFSAIRSSDGSLTVMVINKDLYDPAHPTAAITLNLANFAGQGYAQVYQLAASNVNDPTNAAITHRANATFVGSSLSATVPAQSVTLFVFPAAPAGPQPGQLQFHAASASVSENAGSATIQVDRVAGSSGAVDVSYATTNVSSNITSANAIRAAGTLHFAAGQTSTTFTITLVRNAALTDDFIFSLSLSNPTGGASLRAPATFLFTVLDSELPRVPNGTPGNLRSAAIGFASSHEHFVGFVTDEYRTLLGREPDLGGLNYWVGQLESRTLTDERVESGFIGSPEYIRNHGGPGRGWIVGMYQSLLNRVPAESEIQGWLAILASGQSTDAIAYGFAASRERESIHVRQNYQVYLGRTPAQSEVDGWVNAFLAGATNEDLVAGFIGSNEYFTSPAKGRNNAASWLLTTYRDVLFRTPSVAEIQGWLRIFGFA
jgi:hypothetical protein